MANGFVLWGHCAKPNPHWRYLQARPRALVTFLGPHAYLSPQVYPDLAARSELELPGRALHGRGAAGGGRGAAKDALLKRLIGDHEPSYAAAMARAGCRATRSKMLAGIVGFELRVTALQCKLKLNQHRPESHARLHAAYEAGGEEDRDLARWMERIGLVKEA